MVPQAPPHNGSKGNAPRYPTGLTDIYLLTTEAYTPKHRPKCTCRRDAWRDSTLGEEPQDVRNYLVQCLRRIPLSRPAVHLANRAQRLGLSAVMRRVGIAAAVVIAICSAGSGAVAGESPLQQITPNPNKLNVPPRSFPPPESAQQIGVPTYIKAAKVTNVSPAPLQRGQPLMVDVSVSLAAPISEHNLLAQLRVYIDAVEAVRKPEEKATQTDVGRMGSAGEPSAAPRAPLTSEFTLTLFAVVPATVSSSDVHELSVYSLLDSRTIATQRVEIASIPVTPSQESLGANPAPSTSPAGWLSGRILLLSAAAGLIVLIPLIILILSQRRMRNELARRLAEEQERSAKDRSSFQAMLEEQAHAVREQRADAAAASAAIAAKSGSAEVTRFQIVPPRPAQLPDTLIARAGQGALAIVIGPGVSAQSGLPTSERLWDAILAECARELPETKLGSLRGLSAEEGPDAAMEALVSLVGRDRVVSALQKQLLQSQAVPSRLHRELAALPVRVYIDMTWDELAPVAFNVDPHDVFGPQRTDGFSTGYRSRQRQIIKLFGSVGDPHSLILNDREYRRQVSRSPELQRSIAALFNSQTLLFVGMSLKEISRFLNNLPPELEGAAHPHFALISAESGGDLWQTGLGKKFGVEIIDFSPSPDYRELPDAIAELNAKTSHSQANRGVDLSQAAAKLQYVQLEAIGIFRKLRVDFGNGWTLLLGNNGGGKSTILRAIALALSGNDSRLSTLGSRLLRSGANVGTIEIGIGSTRIVSTLVRDGNSVIVRSPQTTALQAGQVLVLAFPALRGITTAQLHGPTAAGPLNPSVEDVLPLLQGSVDVRLNDLQQWIVNTVLRAEKNSTGREAQMLATFQDLIAEMVPGGHVKFSRLDRTLWTVFMDTGDGEIPLDGMSQGMSSILNWIGVLLQRLYDVYPESSNPEGEPGLVLIDEIDAHLHPRWQRQLVALARRHFPNVQVIASSHSPLLAGAVERDELRIVERDLDTEEMRADPPREDLSGQKVEDILTSSLFSLRTTRSPDAEAIIKRYFVLFEKLSPTNDEERELAELGEKLEALNYGPTRHQKRANDKLKERIEEQVKTLSPTDIAAMQSLLQTSSVAAVPSQHEPEKHQ
jgi:predicted ATP-binding protein involved in virulence